MKETNKNVFEFRRAYLLTAKVKPKDTQLRPTKNHANTMALHINTIPQ